MSLYNIKNKSLHNIPKANWNTDNLRSDIKPFPIFGAQDYMRCIVGLSGGSLVPLRPCHFPAPEQFPGQHSAQPNEDTMILDIVVVKPRDYRIKN